MIFSQDRDTLRRMYRDAWQKCLNSEVLTPLETQIARVVSEHPEYHATIGAGEVDEDFTPEEGRSNPYLHMGMHLAIRDQVATDRPAGIAAVFGKLVDREGGPLKAEHRMMEALGETLWEAQRNQSPPDEAAYLERLRRIT